MRRRPTVNDQAYGIAVLVGLLLVRPPGPPSRSSPSAGLRRRKEPPSRSAASVPPPRPTVPGGSSHRHVRAGYRVYSITQPPGRPLATKIHVPNGRATASPAPSRPCPAGKKRGVRRPDCRNASRHRHLARAPGVRGRCLGCDDRRHGERPGLRRQRVLSPKDFPFVARLVASPPIAVGDSPAAVMPPPPPTAPAAEPPAADGLPDSAGSPSRRGAARCPGRRAARCGRN